MSRHLTGPEENELRKVFGNTLPYSRMYISDGSGIGGAQYTTRNVTDYTLHLGPDMFKGILWSPSFSATFVHESTHVWQGHHEWFPWGFMVNSLLHQAWAEVTHHGNRNYAYEYKYGKKWDDYNVEQQASIVEDWYKGGMDEKDPLFWYISHQIRVGKN